MIWPPEEWRRLEPRVPLEDGRRVQLMGNDNVRITYDPDWI